MNIAFIDQNRRKEARYLSKRSQVVVKHIQNISQIQIDAFSSYQFDRTKPSLEQLISECQTFNTDDTRRIQILNRAFRYHGGLAARIAKSLKSYGIVLEYGDIYGFFWEALVDLPDIWDRRRSTAQMALASTTMNKATKWANENTYRGAVRVPRQQVAKDEFGNTLRTKKGTPKRVTTQIKGVSINYECDLQGLQEILVDAQDSSMLILSLAQ